MYLRIIKYFIVLICCFNYLFADIKFYSIDNALSSDLNTFLSSVSYKKHTNNVMFTTQSIGLALNKGNRYYYRLAYSKGGYLVSFDKTKISCSVDLHFFFRHENQSNFVFSLTPKFIRRINSSYSYTIGLSFPVLQFQDSIFSDTLLSISFNKLIGLDYNSRHSSKYVRSVKKKVLWFWVND